MINDVDSYFLFLRVCELVNECTVVRNEKGFNIRIDNIINAVLVEDMKKWVLHRKVNFNEYYNPDDKISTYRIQRFNTIK